MRRLALFVTIAFSTSSPLLASFAGSHVAMLPAAMVVTASTSENPLGDMFNGLCGSGGSDIPGTPRAVQWEVSVRDRVSGTITSVFSETATYSVMIEPIFFGFVVSFRDIAHAGLDPDAGLEVDVRVSLAGLFVVSTSLDARLAGSAGTQMSIHSVRYPVVDVRALPSDDVAWPIGTGVIFEDAMTDPVVSILGDFTRHPGPASMQWWCLYPEEGTDWHPSFYMSTQDSRGVFKQYLLNPLPDGIRFTVRHVPEDNLNTTCYEQPFSTVLGVVGDDWWAAANRYRKWAEQQPWTARGPIVDDPHFSKHARDMTMFGIFSPDVDADVWAPWSDRHAEQVERFGTTNIVPQNYGWYDHGFDLRFGDWTPRQDFLQEAAEVSSQEVPFSPYTIVHQYSEGSEPVVTGYDPADLVDYAVVREDGTFETQLDLEGRTVYVVCQSTDFASDYAAELAGDLASFGASGMYLDVFNTLAPQLCYATNHGHTPADPENTDRRCELVRDLRAATNDPDFYVSSESVNEMYLGEIEIGMSQWTRNLLGELVTYAPLFETVYHPYLRIGRLGVVLNFDSEKLPPLISQLLARQTYAAHVFMGWTPFAGALMNPDSLADNEASAPIWGLFIDTVDRYMEFLTEDVVQSHVNFGRRLRDPEMDVATVDLTFLGPLLRLLTVPYGPIQPTVYASSWGHNEDGSIVLLLANWTDEIDTQFSGAISSESTVTMTAADLGFDPMWFKEYDEEMTCEVSTSSIVDVCSQGGCQPYSLSYRPIESGLFAKSWKVWHIQAPGQDPVYVGKYSGFGSIELTGHLDPRTMEAFYLEPVKW